MYDLLVGTDIVDIAEFKQSYFGSDGSLRDTVFTADELNGGTVQHMAGIFAAKEAVMKALGIPPGKWLEISILNDPNGKPRAIISDQNRHDIKTADLSISHTTAVAVAMYVAMR